MLKTSLDSLSPAVFAYAKSDYGLVALRDTVTSDANWKPIDYNGAALRRDQKDGKELRFKVELEIQNASERFARIRIDPGRGTLSSTSGRAWTADEIVLLPMSAKGTTTDSLTWKWDLKLTDWIGSTGEEDLTTAFDLAFEVRDQGGNVCDHFRFNGNLNALNEDANWIRIDPTTLRFYDKYHRELPEFIDRTYERLEEPEYR
jgi:hypothetical protein